MFIARIGTPERCVVGKLSGCGTMIPPVRIEFLEPAGFSPPTNQVCRPDRDTMTTTNPAALSAPAKLPLGNEQLAAGLAEIADLLDAQQANPHRVRAYRTAADTLRRLDRPASDILAAEGSAGLQELPGIGQSLARTIEQLASTGKLSLLERLRGDMALASVLTTVGGIGPELAERIHQELGIDRLADLEIAAHDGRLARVPGMGPKRIRSIRESLAGRFRRGPQIPESKRQADRSDQPAVAELLDVDREYREKAAANGSRRSRPAGSTPSMSPGCRSSTPTATTGITPPSTPTRPGPTNSAPRTTGW